MTSWQEEFEKVKQQYDNLPDDGTLETIGELANKKKELITQLLKVVHLCASKVEHLCASSEIDALMILTTAANSICIRSDDPHAAIDKICEMMHIQAEICLKNEETEIE